MAGYICNHLNEKGTLDWEDFLQEEYIKVLFNRLLYKMMSNNWLKVLTIILKSLPKSIFEETVLQSKSIYRKQFIVYFDVILRITYSHDIPLKNAQVYMK